MKKKLYCLLIIIMLLIASCKVKNNQYGIVLDSENRNKLPNGSLVIINEIDLNRKIANITYNNQIFMVFDYTIEKFKTKSDAENFLKDFESLSNKYALNKKDILPLRSEPNNYKDNIIYRIPKNSTLKVLNIGEETKAGSLPGRWIYALTKDGYKGYVFDYSIEIYDNIPGKIISNPMSAENQKEALELLKNLKYLRPYYYERMISNKSYELKKFNDEYGLFFAKDDLIKIILSEAKVQYKFNRIDEVKPSGYLFRGDDPNEFILLEKLDMNSYNALVKLKSVNFEYKFVLIEQDIKDIVATSEKQNQKLVSRLSSYQNLSNSKYGNIKFNPDLTFTWEIKGNLEQNLPTSGQYEIIGITPNLQLSYKSAIKLVDSNKTEYFFLLDYTDNALQMILINRSKVNENIISNDKEKLDIILFEGKFISKDK